MAINRRTVHPVHAINRYLWAEITRLGILNAADYNGGKIIPIVPVEETPELLQVITAGTGMGTKPFIVYNWTKVDTGSNWMVETQEIAYSIRSADSRAMRELINLFDDLFKRYDESAQELNEWLRTNIAPTSTLRSFHFYTTNISTLGGQMPTDTEDGMNESLISLRVQFN